jgi:SagB-type dehydrogenase family enzyme
MPFPFRRRDPPSPPQPAPPSPADALAAVTAYHQATKHHQHRYAAGPGELDWATQPDPFRRYRGAPLVSLERPPPPASVTGAVPTWSDILTGGVTPAAPVDRASVSQLLFDSLALSAWKRYGTSRWSLRVNPSSGNLHPVEGYVAAGPIAGLWDEPTVAHYAPEEHALELRAALPAPLWSSLTADLPPGSLIAGLSAIHWREAWKYGERAFRYSQQDTGHALAALAIAAAGLGWRCALADSPSSAEMARLLGIWTQRGVEAEHAQTLLLLHPPLAPAPSRQGDPEAFARCEELSWRGEPNELSPGHVDWGRIDAAEAWTRKPRTPPWPALDLAPAPEPDRGSPALRALVRQRRSAVDFDGRASIASEAFFRALARTLPSSAAPWGALPWLPSVDLVLFVHHVEGLASGLYLLLRDPGREPRLREACRRDFDWARPEGCPAGLALVRLRAGDVRSLARSVSCHQEIAADGCFAAAMLAEFRPSLETNGAWFYRHLHWEAGFVGQILYLEAEAAGLRATGMGCFFDDALHAALGLATLDFQSLYHFTVGGAVEDPRLTTEPAYVE